MKKQGISINLDKFVGQSGWVNLEAVYNKETIKKSGGTWDLLDVAFITTKAPKGMKGVIVGNVSEFRDKEEPMNFPMGISDMEMENLKIGGVNPADIPF